MRFSAEAAIRCRRRCWPYFRRVDAEVTQAVFFSILQAGHAEVKKRGRMQDCSLLVRLSSSLSSFSGPTSDAAVLICHDAISPSSTPGLHAADNPSLLTAQQHGNAAMRV